MPSAHTPDGCSALPTGVMGILAPALTEVHRRPTEVTFKAGIFPRKGRLPEEIYYGPLGLLKQLLLAMVAMVFGLIWAHNEVLL